MKRTSGCGTASLSGRLFSEAGFSVVTAADYRTSNIPGWARYNFDQSAYGEYPLEPSLYMEGTK